MDNIGISERQLGIYQAVGSEHFLLPFSLPLYHITASVQKWSAWRRWLIRSNQSDGGMANLAPKCSTLRIAG